MVRSASVGKLGSDALSSFCNLLKDVMFVAISDVMTRQFCAVSSLCLVDMA
jgi:hypothetical protein